MGKWVHRLVNKDLEKLTADCAACGKGIKIVFHHKTWRCKKARKWQIAGSKKRYQQYRGIYLLNNQVEIYTCNKCEIQNKDFRFFDINHIDGNSNNNEIENLEALCPNCHRIETLRQHEERMEELRLIQN